MKFLSVLLLAAAGTAIAKDHHGGKNSTASQCREMFKLERLEKIAGNGTLLNEVTKNNATKAQEIKDKAEKGKATLQSLQSNSTLMGECTKIAAKTKEARDCAEMVGRQKLMALVGNQTALDAKTKNNATKADALKKKAEAGRAKMVELQSNSTLTQFCSVLEDKASCRVMSKLQREVAHANNATFLADKFGSNSTKIEKFRAKAAKAEGKLKTMMGNSTLMSFCQSEKSGAAGTAASGSTQNGSPVKAAASGIQAFGVSASLLALLTTGLVTL